MRQMLERVALDPDLFALKWAGEYQFAQGADGIEIHDTEGNPAMVMGDDDKPREATFTEADIKALCQASPHKDSYNRILVGTRASGGGASGPGCGGATKPDKPAAKVAPLHFGLN